MGYGKKIELFLKEGFFGGTVIAEMSNWNGKGIKVARDKIESEAELDDIGVGVYFLFCGNPATSVYIGESDDIKKRLKQHKADYTSGKETFYWEVAVCVLGRDLDKAKIQYLEDLLVKDARNAGSLNVLTKVSRPAVKIKASAKAEMDEFAEYSRALVEVLGYKVFVKGAVPASRPSVPAPSPVPSQDEEPAKAVSSYPRFILEKPKQGIKATMERRGDKAFVLLPDSKLSATLFASFWERFVKERETMIKNGDIDAGYVLKAEFQCDSPSAAAVFVLGRSASGTREWKDPSGMTYEEWTKVHGGAGK